MAVQVTNNAKPTAIETGGTAASGKTNSGAREEKGIFENVLNSLKELAGDTPVNNAPSQKLEHRPSTSMITNPEFHKAQAKAMNSNSSIVGDINKMAVSALISATALSSGQSRMNNLYAMSSGMAARGSSLSPSSPFSGVSQSGGSLSHRAQGIGGLSAKFESGESGPAIIGYDEKGGTSYGTFQISSRAGSMRQFIDYLHDVSPDWARRLEAAGPANTGGRKGRMPEVWKKIAAEEPVKFAKAQYDYIEQSHYLPALKEIASRTGVDIGQAPTAIKEVLWSTAVQHGARGAARIFTKAIGRSKTASGGIQAAQLINSIYAMRAGQFGSSSAYIKAAARSRFREEGQIALAMLSEPFAPDSARA